MLSRSRSRTSSPLFVHRHHPLPHHRQHWMEHSYCQMWLLSWIRSTATPPDGDGDFADWWLQASRSTPQALRKGTSSLIMLTAWWIWKQRNAVVFDNASPSVGCLLATIQSEARSWAAVGAIGLGALIPAAP